MIIYKKKFKYIQIVNFFYCLSNTAIIMSIRES
jgi:hypothetical protein